MGCLTQRLDKQVIFTSFYLKMIFLEPLSIKLGLQACHFSNLVIFQFNNALLTQGDKTLQC